MAIGTTTRIVGTPAVTVRFSVSTTCPYDAVMATIPVWSGVNIPLVVITPLEHVQMTSPASVLLPASSNEPENCTLVSASVLVGPDRLIESTSV